MGHSNLSFENFPTTWENVNNGINADEKFLAKFWTLFVYRGLRLTMRFMKSYRNKFEAIQSHLPWPIDAWGVQVLSRQRSSPILSIIYTKIYESTEKSVERKKAKNLQKKEDDVNEEKKRGSRARGRRGRETAARTPRWVRFYEFSCGTGQGCRTVAGD